jgi:radical SAM superfamily enzyme YgiQ (UPF0313 family)
MEKNILMVYPKIASDTYWGFEHSLSFIDKKAAMPPLGLITLAPMIKNHDLSYNIKLVDENVEKLRNKDLKWADIVMTSSMIVQSESLEKVISRAKKYDNLVVAGGPHPTQFYERPNMNSSPVPMYELLNMNAYGSMAIQYSRGCPMACDFCNEPALFGHKSRVKNAERFIAELSKIYDLGYRGSVFVVDDNFI